MFFFSLNAFSPTSLHPLLKTISIPFKWKPIFYPILSPINYSLFQNGNSLTERYTRKTLRVSPNMHVHIIGEFLKLPANEENEAQKFADSSVNKGIESAKVPSNGWSIGVPMCNGFWQ